MSNFLPDASYFVLSFLLFFLPLAHQRLLLTFIQPPGDFSRAALKKTRKIPIPEKEYPDYNFIGLIIGPRGNTQKRLERESGAKISIRGRGSVKEGKIKKGTPQPDDDEALHVLVTGDTDEQVEKAYTLIMPLLTPMDENQNEWKKQQLRELAEINGTLRDRTWMQPLPDYDAHITCAICGDASHPTADCPMKGKGVQATTKTQKMDNEYDSFMKEIGEAPKPIEDKTYKEFMHAISEGTIPLRANYVAYSFSQQSTWYYAIYAIRVPWLASNGNARNAWNATNAWNA